MTLLQAKNPIRIPGVREKMRDRNTLENGVVEDQWQHGAKAISIGSLVLCYRPKKDCLFHNTGQKWGKWACTIIHRYLYIINQNGKTQPKICRYGTNINSKRFMYLNCIKNFYPFGLHGFNINKLSNLMWCKFVTHVYCANMQYNIISIPKSLYSLCYFCLPP